MNEDVLGGVRRSAPPGPIREEYWFKKIDHAAWQSVEWIFRFMRSNSDNVPAYVACSRETLCCDISENEESRAKVRLCFVRTRAGPKLQRIEVEPRHEMEGIER